MVASSVQGPASAAQQAADEKVMPILRQSWQAYKVHFIQADGRVIDPTADNITTSEGQSYAMLRAVWMDDRPAFDLSWQWTKNNLFNKKDGLFSWKWGQRCDKSWGVLDDQAASDADQDIALALILASKQWNRPDLMGASKQVLSSIWRSEVAVIDHKPYLAAGPWARDMSKPRLNPSYFAPYAYRVFAKVDRDHDWASMVDTSYDVLEQASSLSRLELPPDWCNIDPATKKVELDPEDKESDYSYDAMRVCWRIAQDANWDGEERAKKYLERLAFLEDSWTAVRTIRGAYSATGVTRSFDEPLAGFGCILPMLHLTAPSVAQEILQERIMSYYYEGIWRPEDDYYGQNWAWFGLAAMSNNLPKPQL